MTLSISCWSMQLWRAALFFLAATLLLSPGQGSAANWSVKDLNDGVIDTSGVGFSIEGLSGVNYVGASPEMGKQRFMAIQDSNNSPATSSLVIFDVTFSKNGNITAAEAVDRILVNESLFFGGIVSTGTSVFLAYDNTGTPSGSGVREYDLASGELLQSVAIPMVYTGNERSNFGFESLARDRDTKMWTANESALTVDGPAATTEAGTLVRILEFDVAGNTVTAAGQFAYEVESIHTTGGSPSTSGLVELVSLPDGTLLALENSFSAFVSPVHRSSIYEIDFTGLNGVDLTPVGKSELWSDQAGGGLGQDLEGLTVGPSLGDGKWVLFGVVDNSDYISTNTVVSLEIESSTPVSPGLDTADFDEDGDVDGKDFLQWQRGFNVASLAGLGHGDANFDGDIDAADEMIWEGQFGVSASPSIDADFDQDNNIDGNDFLIWQRGRTTLAEGDSDGSMTVDGVDLANWESRFGDVISPLTAIQTVPEPSTLGLLLVGTLAVVARRRRG